MGTLYFTSDPCAPPRDHPYPHAEANLLFGRGFRAGIDRREQKKAAAGQEAELLRSLRSRTGARESVADRERDETRAADADRYEGRDMAVDSHWSEKSREEMTERDWRIFREDFSIGYKGTNVPMPLRNWEEANFPEPLRKVGGVGGVGLGLEGWGGGWGREAMSVPAS